MNSIAIDTTCSQVLSPFSYIFAYPDDSCPGEHAYYAQHRNHHYFNRGCDADIYDVAWSPDSDSFMTGSIDNSVIIWSVAQGQGRILHRIQDHSHYVQGCAWDPLNALIVSQSCDRSARVYSFSSTKGGKPKLVQTMRKRAVPKRAVPKVAEIPGGAAKDPCAPPQPNVTTSAQTSAQSITTVIGSQGLFMDESVPSFFRRPDFSPDGTILCLPAGTKSHI